MRIDVADLSPVSDMLRKVVRDYIDSLPADVVSQMRGYHVENSSDVRIAIEHYLGPGIADPLYEQISSLLEPCEMVCYHATRLTAPECVRTTGLKRIHWDWYGKMLLTVMQSVGIAPSDCECAIKLVEREYERKLQLQGRTICFFSGLDLLEDDGQLGYAWFSQNMGGELARWALREKMPQVLAALKQIGIPMVVKFVAPFSAMASGKESVEYEFVCHEAAKYLWGYNYSIQFDGRLTCDIPPENILEMLPYLDTANYV